MTSTNDDKREPANVVDIRQVRDARDEIHRVVEQLVEGNLVILPTETSYCITAFALNEAAV